MTTIDRPQAADRAGWERLARAYKAFDLADPPPADYDSAWQRVLASDGVHAFVARLDGQLVGLVHYLFHASTWPGDACYLQDLYVDEAVRGRGIARALIERVAEAARERGAARMYWLTQDHNALARALYDRVAEHRGFLRYDYPL